MVNGAQFTRLMQMAALALLFASDGYQLVITGLTGSFAALPLAGGIDLAQPVQAIVTAVSGMFLAAVQIAGPLLVVLFLADVGLGLLTRVAPALNAFAARVPAQDPPDPLAGRLHVPGPAADRLQPRRTGSQSSAGGGLMADVTGKNRASHRTSG